MRAPHPKIRLTQQYLSDGKDAARRRNRDGSGEFSSDLPLKCPLVRRPSAGQIDRASAAPKFAHRHFFLQKPNSVG